VSSPAGLAASSSHPAGDSGAGRGFTKIRVTRDSPLWLVLVAGLFMIAELIPAQLPMGLGVDEITYIAQTSVHASQVILPPVHGRGPALLAAPITLLTTSIPLLRVWMAALSALGLFLALLAWRGLRPVWVLAVAGVVIGSFAIAELGGVQVLPDWWVALGGLAVIGLFMQAVTGRIRRRVVLPLLAASTFFLILLRPQDAAVLMAPVIAAALMVPAWRHRGVLAASGAGIAAGAVEWLGESYAWYGGPASRLHMMSQEPPKFALHFTLPAQLRVLNGPWYCEPGTCHGWRYPWLTIWWLALLALIILGVFATRRTALASSAVAVAAALSVLAGYTLFVPYYAPRYLIPVLALLAIPAADGIAWLVAVPRWRAAAVFLVVAFLLTGVVTQQFVRGREVATLDAAWSSSSHMAGFLSRHGARPPCIIPSTSLAYYLGCSAPWTGQQIQALLALSPGGATAWRELQGVGLPVYVRK
jgi:hypothetical protein